MAGARQERPARKSNGRKRPAVQPHDLEDLQRRAMRRRLIGAQASAAPGVDHRRQGRLAAAISSSSRSSAARRLRHGVAVDRGPPQDLAVGGIDALELPVCADQKHRFAVTFAGTVSDVAELDSQACRTYRWRDRRPGVARLHDQKHRFARHVRGPVSCG